MAEILKADYRSLKAACTALQEGKVIAFPTETVYGIGVMHGNKEGIELLRKIKGREQDKPFQILIPNTGYASKYVNTDHPRAEVLMNSFWPGPLTLVMEDLDGGTSGLRVPNNKWLRVLMFELGCGLVATSANISGDEPAISAESINESLGEDLSLIIDGGEAAIGESSTVAAITLDGNLEIYREGALPEKTLRDVFNS